MKRAVVVGSRGQDGRLLDSFLKKNGFEVAGISRTGAGSGPSVDIFSAEAVAAFIKNFRPDQVYYLAAFHHSAQEAAPENAALEQLSRQTHVEGLRNFLEAMLRSSPQSRLFYAASSLIFGDTPSERQNENTPFQPNSLYGQTKLEGMMLCREFRRRHKIFAATGILYNHESSLRAEKFVSQKIIEGAVKIKRGLAKELVLGDLEAITDWGYAPDYVRAMAAILEAQVADDFIVATGEPHTVRDFVEEVFGCLGLKWQDFVKVDPALVRRKKAILVGDPQKLKAATGWHPQTSFSEMIRLMIEAKGTVLE